MSGAAHPEAGSADTTGVVVRDARSDEFAAAGNLVADVYGAEGYAAGPHLDVLRDAGRRAAEADLLVAVDPDGRILGTLTYSSGPGPFADVAQADEASFRMLAVAPDARGQGVGERLVRACIERARAAGKRRLVMSTQPAMRDAHRLYERLGFVRAPERDWSPEPGLRLQVFALDLDGAGHGRGKAVSDDC